MNKIQIDPNCCIICCECINICKQEVIGMRQGKVQHIYPDKCISCEECIDICPSNCITIDYLVEVEK